MKMKLPNKPKERFDWTLAFILLIFCLISLFAIASAQTTGQYKYSSGELVNFVAQQVGGKGGGRPDMAQAGGTQPEHLAKALASVPDWVRAKL